MQQDNINKRINRMYNNISNIAAQRNKEPPTTIVMGLSTFEEWYYYCKVHNLDYMRWEGKQILIDSSSPPKLLAASYHFRM